MLEKTVVLHTVLRPEERGNMTYFGWQSLIAKKP